MSDKHINQQPVPEGHNVCKKCGRELPLSAFGSHSRSKDGKQAYCKECLRQSISEGWKKRHEEAKTPEAVSVHPDNPMEYLDEYYKDEDLANELRRRGYTVKATKTTVIEL